jgi:hypothetical protein
MLADARNSSFYPDWLAYIESEKAKDGFRYIVGLALGRDVDAQNYCRTHSRRHRVRE